MVLLIIIPFLNGYFIGKINPTFSDKPICLMMFDDVGSIFSPCFSFLENPDDRYLQPLSFFRRREGTLEVPTFVAAEDQSAVSQATLHTWTMHFFVQIGSQNLWLTMGFSVGEVVYPGFSV